MVASSTSSTITDLRGHKTQQNSNSAVRICKRIWAKFYVSSYMQHVSWNITVCAIS